MTITPPLDDPPAAGFASERARAVGYAPDHQQAIAELVPTEAHRRKLIGFIHARLPPPDSSLFTPTACSLMANVFLDVRRANPARPEPEVLLASEAIMRLALSMLPEAESPVARVQ